MLATLPVLGPKYSVSLEISLSSHCTETECTVMAFSTAADTSLGLEDKISVTLTENEISIKVAKDKTDLAEITQDHCWIISY